MQRKNLIPITALALSMIMTVPLAFGMSTASIDGNLIKVENDSKGGMTLGDDSEVVLNPVYVDDQPAFRIQQDENDPNLLPTKGINSSGTVNFEITVPQGTHFMIYAYIKRTGTLDPTDINLDIHINGEDFSAEVKPGPYTPFRGYFSAKHVDGNNVMLPISADDLLPEHYMVCEEKEAVLDVDARRSWTGTAKIELYIVYM